MTLAKLAFSFLVVGNLLIPKLVVAREFKSLGCVCESQQDPNYWRWKCFLKLNYWDSDSGMGSKVLTSYIDHNHCRSCQELVRNTKVCREGNPPVSQPRYYPAPEPVRPPQPVIPVQTTEQYCASISIEACISNSRCRVLGGEYSGSSRGVGPRTYTCVPR